MTALSNYAESWVSQVLGFSSQYDGERYTFIDVLIQFCQV